jgi:hypothetical protein
VPSYSSHAVHWVQVHLLLKVLLGHTDQGQEFVHITEPESTWNNSFISWKGLQRNTLYFISNTKITLSSACIHLINSPDTAFE